MKTDRELLELAARAAGESFSHKIDDAVQGKRTGPFVVRRQRWTQWNPLTNDGDALRLAVKLSLLVDVCNGHTCVCNEVVAPFEQDHGNDADAATRRAIVRAAAAIGEGME